VKKQRSTLDFLYEPNPLFARGRPLSAAQISAIEARCRAQIPLCTVSVAKRLQLEPYQVRRLISRGKLAASKRGSRYVVAQGVVDAFKAAQL
jgi:hypothetical protein